MRLCAFALVFLAQLQQGAFAQEKAKEASAPAVPSTKLQVPDLLKAIQAAYSTSTAKELAAMATPEFQKSMSATTLGAVFKAWKTHYGNWKDSLEEIKQTGPLHIYKVTSERGVLRLRLTLDDTNHLKGIGLLPAFLDDLPAKVDLPTVKQRLSEAARSTLGNFQVPSISLALVKGDQIVWKEAFGYQNLSHHFPADADTAYITGSILKVVVATALMQQVDAGKLDLDAPVNKYLNGLQIPNPFEKDQPLTTRHLLSHHGGVPNGAQMVSLWRRELPLSLDEVVRKRVRVTRKPGEAFQYSNYGFALNGYLLAQLQGVPFERALSKSLLEPLDMKATVFEPAPAMLENLAVPYANSGLERKVAPTAFMRLDVYPAGDAFSTPADMARFLIPHLNEGKYQGKQILSAKAVKEMATPQFAAKDARSGQGLGWMINTIRGRKLLWHNGAVPGFYTYIAINPDKKSGAVLFCNKYNPLEGGLGLLADPLVDLRELAIELLDRLEPAQVSSRNP